MSHCLSHLPYSLKMHSTDISHISSEHYNNLCCCNRNLLRFLFCQSPARKKLLIVVVQAIALLIHSIHLAWLWKLHFPLWKLHFLLVSGSFPAWAYWLLDGSWHESVSSFPCSSHTPANLLMLSMRFLLTTSKDNDSFLFSWRSRLDGKRLLSLHLMTLSFGLRHTW